jgi:hypothetical protein
MKKSCTAGHVETCKLFDAAEGHAKLKAAERAHLHRCEQCQFIFTVFIKGEIDNPPSKKAARDTAA